MLRTTETSAVVPWRFFAAHLGEPFAFFLDRGTGSRPSFAGSRPREQLVVDSSGVRIWREGRWHEQAGDPLASIEAFVAASRVQPAALPAWLAGRALPRTVGFLAYELGCRADGARIAATAHANLPLAVLSTYDEIDAWDPDGGRSVRVRFASARPGDVPVLPTPPSSAWTATPREDYASGFARIREAIAAGEIYQANLSRRAVHSLLEAPAAAYARLRQVQPVPWGAYLDFGGFALLSNSPECFLVRDGASLLTQPIKGTRPRREDAREDAAIAYELRTDSKETAEHLMIVDLERNDLGRVAKTGSVEVPRYAEVESFATVHHLVSDVRAHARDGVGLAELLRATFPGGSITGAPKIRAMEILAEVESEPRGPYTGAIGFFNGSESLELSIAIRTAVAAGGKLLCQAGGGIVADSDCEREWNETELKLAAFERAFRVTGHALRQGATSLEARGDNDDVGSGDDRVRGEDDREFAADEPQRASNRK